MTDGIHTYVTLEKNFETLRQIEESGKILGKDLWVMSPPNRKTPLKGLKRDNAPERLENSNEVTTLN